MKTRLLLFLSLLSITIVNAQNKSDLESLVLQNTIKGTVVERNTKTPLPFAYLTIAEEGLGTVTDGDGKFQIYIPKEFDSSILSITYMGFEDLNISVADFKAKNGNIFMMKAETVALNEVTVTPEKIPNVKSLLRKVIKNIPDNYANNPTVINGYYRETMKENGVYIKYSDAVCDYYSVPYTNSNYKWKEYQNPYDFSASIGAFSYNTNSLHRIHFHHRTLKEEQVKVTKARSSSSLSKRDFYANIEGGPLSLFARNRVKYQESFLGKKAMRDFNYTISEELNEQGSWVYVLDFHTKTTKAMLDNLASTKNRRQWKKANNRKLLKGRIYINRDDLAVLRYECHVPNDLKQYFCGYNLNEIKHFDYKLDVRFKKKGATYDIDKMRHEDEFIFKDSISQNTTYYSALSEFNTSEIVTENVNKFSKEENFANTNSNQLYELPLDYDADFWNTYTANNQVVKIESTIRKDMEVEKSLEQQFRDKHLRDDNMMAPIAKKETYSFDIHGEKYIDDYAWLKDTKAPNNNTAVMEYLRKENEYTANYNIPLKQTQRKIYQELIRSVEKNTTSLPTKENGFLYYYSYTEDDEHPIYYRKANEKDAVEEELLNVNELAKEQPYYAAVVGSPSPNNNLITVYENTSGKDEYILKVKDLNANIFLNDSITRIGNVVWLDNTSFLYSNLEEKTFRSSKIMRHTLGTNPKSDTVVYEETDPSFEVSISKSKSKAYIFLNSASSTSSETWYLRTDNPSGEFKIIKPREKNHRYDVTHYKNHFYIITNKNAINYKIASVAVNEVDKGKWTEIIPHQPGVLIESFQLFDKYLVLKEKTNAQSQIRVNNLSNKKSHFIKLKEDFYNISLGYNPDFATDTLQFRYSSFKTPLSTFNYHMETTEKRLVKQHTKSIASPYNIYKIERKWVSAKDGKQIPLTLISNRWRAKTNSKNNNHKVYLTSYGSYGFGQDIATGSTAHHLVNMGYVYAIAHVRGGDDMGREWYEDGKLFNKKNTFSDFIACAEYLISENYAKKGSIVAEGNSAGGLLMGAVVNERPELFNTVILNVPFVDVVNTMLDENLPLTVGEFEEWGNPKNKKAYQYIKSYSPYDNVKEQAYPNLLFFTGLNDTRVGYWEPAKMVAKLRTTKTDDNLLLLKTDFTNGHSGGSGRYAGFRDSAYKLALIHDLNKTHVVNP